MAQAPLEKANELSFYLGRGEITRIKSLLSKTDSKGLFLLDGKTWVANSVNGITRITLPTDETFSGKKYQINFEFLIRDSGAVTVKGTKTDSTNRNSPTTNPLSNGELGTLVSKYPVVKIVGGLN